MKRAQYAGPSLEHYLDVTLILSQRLQGQRIHPELIPLEDLNEQNRLHFEIWKKATTTSSTTKGDTPQLDGKKSRGEGTSALFPRRGAESRDFKEPVASASCTLLVCRWTHRVHLQLP